MEYILKFNTRINEFINKRWNVKIREIILFVLIFCISGINFYNEFSIFSIAIYIAMLKNDKHKLLRNAFLLGVTFFTNDKEVFIKLIYLMFFTALITGIRKKERGINLKRLNIYVISGLYSLLHLILEIGALTLSRNINYYMLMIALLVSILLFTTSIIFEKAVKFLMKANKNVVDKEGVVSFILVVLLTLVGMKNFYFSGIYVQELLIILILEIASYSFGELYGALTGTLLTLPIVFSGGYDVNISILPFIGVIMGCMRKLNKIVYSILFTLMTYVVYLTYADSINMSVSFLYSLLFAQCIFLIIPKEVYEKCTEVYENLTKLKKKTYFEKVKEQICSKLLSENKKVMNLARTVEKNIENGEFKKDNKDKIDEVIRLSCGNCMNKDLCWRDNFYSTYTYVLEVFGELKQNIKYEEILEKMKRRKCINSETLIKNMQDGIVSLDKKQGEIKKCENAKKIMLSSLFEIGTLMNKVTNEISNYKMFRTHYEDLIIDKLREQDIDVNEIIVCENQYGRYEVSVFIEDNKYAIDKKIERILKGIFNKNFSCKCQKDGDVFLYKFEESPKYRVKCGSYQIAKRDKSGDRYSIMKFESGITMVAIADGMGKGEEAREESESALEVLENLVSLDFNRTYIIDFINTILYEKNKELYTTLDVCLLDAYTGKTEFIKNASASTYIKRDDEILEIKASAMPIGIIENLEVTSEKIDLRSGDVIFMVSDGAIDNINSENKREEIFKSMIKSILSTTPSDIARELGSMILEDNIIKDDMTILVLCVDNL